KYLLLVVCAKSTSPVRGSMPCRGILGMSLPISIPDDAPSGPHIDSHAPDTSWTTPSSPSVNTETSSWISSRTQIKPVRFSFTHRLADPVVPFRFLIGITSPHMSTPLD